MIFYPCVVYLQLNYNKDCVIRSHNQHTSFSINPFWHILCGLSNASSYCTIACGREKQKSICHQVHATLCDGMKL